MEYIDSFLESKDMNQGNFLNKMWSRYAKCLKILWFKVGVGAHGSRCSWNITMKAKEKWFHKVTGENKKKGDGRGNGGRRKREANK